MIRELSLWMGAINGQVPAQADIWVALIVLGAVIWFAASRLLASGANTGPTRFIDAGLILAAAVLAFNAMN